MDALIAETDDTTRVSASETEDEVKGTQRKERKELFQINTHPAAVISANNKRDRRLKQIVMRVVAFCKREHEEGLQIPFRFFKKRAAAMTGVSLSTIHRIETIDMKEPSPQSDVSVKSKTKKSSSKTAKKKKKKESDGGIGANSVNVSNTAVTAAAVPLIHYNDMTGSDQIHLQTLPANPIEPQAGVAKPVKKRKKKVKTDNDRVKPDSSIININPTPSNNNTHPSLSSNMTTIQPAVLHSVSTVAEGVTTISLHNPVATTQQHPPCTWTARPIGPFAVGDLRDGHHVQVPAASHVQVTAQPMQVASAIPVGTQLQPICVTGPQQAFTGHIGTNNWPTSAVGPFGTLQTTATLVGQQVVQTYPTNTNAPPNHPQQPQQQQPIFYQF